MRKTDLSLRRVRSRGKQVMNAYSRLVAHFAYEQFSTNWADWTYRRISQRQAELLVLSGEAERITRQVNGVVQVVGYRATKPTSLEDTNPACLTPWSSLLLARDGGKEERLSRKERDEIIRIRVYPLIVDAKSPLTGPRMTEAERLLGNKLLTGRGAQPMRKAA